MCVLFSSNSIYALRIEYLIFSSVVFLFFSHFELKIILSSVELLLVFVDDAAGVMPRPIQMRSIENGFTRNGKLNFNFWKFQNEREIRTRGIGVCSWWTICFFFFDPEKREKTNRSIHAIWTTLITNRISLFREIYKRRARTLPPVPRAFMNREMTKTKHVQWAMTIRSLCVLFGDREESLKFE